MAIDGKTPSIRRTLELLSQLPHVDGNDRYTMVDKSRDFKITFMEDLSGKRTLSLILNMAPLLASTYHGGNQSVSDYMSGRRDVVLEILGHLLYDEVLTDQPNGGIIRE